MPRFWDVRLRICWSKPLNYKPTRCIKGIMMKYIEQIRGLVSRGEVQEASKNLLGDTLDAILGDPISAGKIMLALASSPFFIRDQLFWTKIEAFLDGVYLEEDDCATLRAKLTENGEKQENALRLVECIDRVETRKKIGYLINATRCCSGALDLFGDFCKFA